MAREAFSRAFRRRPRGWFSAVEVLFPYEASDAVLAELVTAHELQMVLINAPAGDWAAGERAWPPWMVDRPSFDRAF